MSIEAQEYQYKGYEIIVLQERLFKAVVSATRHEMTKIDWVRDPIEASTPNVALEMARKRIDAVC